MKILHCCLANFYIDSYSYQENIITKMHKLQGHEVKIVASTETFDENLKYTYVEPSRYINEHGIEVVRVPYKNLGNSFVSRKLRLYKDIYPEIENFEPDIIFLHGVSFLGTYDFKRYLKKNPNVKLYADSHADYNNSSTNWLSKNILHRVVYRHSAQVIAPYAEMIYGVLPIRVEFLKDIYRLPENKVSLLPLGVDDSLIDISQKEIIRHRARKHLGIDKEDFVVITGGKIDRKKNTHILVNAFNKLDDKKVHLIIFGKPTDNMQEEFKSLIKNNNNIHHIGWVDNEQAMTHTLASDLSVYPGTHSVLWEMSIGLGIPTLIKKWNGIDHLKISEQLGYLTEDNEAEILNWLKKCIYDKSFYKIIQNEFEEKGTRTFRYSEIAKKAIGL